MPLIKPKGANAIFTITYSVTLRDILLQQVTCLKRLLIVISISLPLTIWYFLSLASVRYFLYTYLSPSTGGFVYGGLSGGLGAFNGTLIGALLGILVGTLFTYRKTAHKLKDFTVTLSEEALSIKAPDVSTETLWQNVSRVTNNKHHVQILTQRPPLLISVISVPKRAFENTEDADAFGEAAVKHWQIAREALKRAKASK